MFCLHNMLICESYICTLYCDFYSNQCLESEIFERKTKALSGYIVVIAGKLLQSLLSKQSYAHIEKNQ